MKDNYDFDFGELSNPFLKIRFAYGNFIEPPGWGPKIILHTVDDTGKFTDPASLAIKNEYRAAYKEYNRWHKSGKGGKSALPFRSGYVLLTDVTRRGWIIGRDKAPDTWVASLLCVQSGRAVPFNVGSLKVGLKRAGNFAKQWGASIHMPKIGAGQGGDWKQIRPLIDSEILSQGVPVTVYDVE